MKKIISILCAAALAAALTACGSSAGSSAGSASSQTSATESEDGTQTIYGKVTAVSGNTVTVETGELTQFGGGEGAGGDGQTPPDMTEGGSSESSSDSSSQDAQQPPELPDGESGQGGSSDNSTQDSQIPPEKPDGESSDGSQPSGDMPSGNAPGGDGGEMPSGDAPSGSGGNMEGGMGDFDPSQTAYSFTSSGETEEYDISGAEIKTGTVDVQEDASADDIAEGSFVQLVIGDDGTVETVVVRTDVMEMGEMGGTPNGGGDPGSGDGGDIEQGSAANTISEDGEYEGETYESSGDDENALRVDGATVTLDGITVNKSGGESSNQDSGDFYGMNAGLLATNGATVTIEDATVTTSAKNGNGVFSYGSGTTVNISDSTITTSADCSGGIQTTGGGETNAENLTITTGGNSSAAIRSDKGGGTVNVDGGSYETNGYNSPAVYSTAEISITDATLTATNSEGLVIEGENSISLTDCEVSGNMSDDKGTSSDENVHTVMIYQSTSGDAEEGVAAFSMSGGSLTSNNGDVIHVTNTEAVITLSDVEIINNDSEGYILSVTGNSASHGWGTAGSNGAQVTFTADNQSFEGNIIVDEISTLDMTFSNGCSFTGTINIVENEEGGTAVSDNIDLVIEDGCTWTLTGDCTLSTLENSGTINYNGYKITLADGTVLSE